MHLTKEDVIIAFDKAIKVKGKIDYLRVWKGEEECQGEHQRIDINDLSINTYAIGDPCLIHFHTSGVKEGEEG